MACDEIDSLAGLCGGDGRQHGAVGVENGEVAPRDEGDDVREVVAAVEAHAETSWQAHGTHRSALGHRKVQ